MTDAEVQELFARLERLERSNWRWKVLASVLGVIFLLLLSLGLVSAVAIQGRLLVQHRLAVEQEQQARMQAEEARREAAEADIKLQKEAASRAAAPKRMPKEPGPDEVP